MHRAVRQARHAAHRQLTPTQPAGGEASGAMLSCWWSDALCGFPGACGRAAGAALCAGCGGEGAWLLPGRLAACMGLAVVSCSCLHAHTGHVCSGTCNSGVALVRFSNAPRAAALSCTECVAPGRWACGALCTEDPAVTLQVVAWALTIRLGSCVTLGQQQGFIGGSEEGG